MMKNPYRQAYLSAGLDPDECTVIYVGTTLLYCPDPEDLAPTICVATISGCASLELRVALSAADGCGTTEVCSDVVSGNSYSYSDDLLWSTVIKD